ncbi:MAG TPA: response regulator transcription factor [Actinomycetaceae bacterium]|nr:response regulator transcription factor [Actinomycetaceae bacterium]
MNVEDVPPAPQDDPIRVALVDDQQLVRAGFAMVIGSQPDMTVTFEASDGHQAIRMLDAYPTDVVLMDVRMSGMDGLSATEAITAQPPRTGVCPRIIILTTFDLDEYVMHAIRAGASGFLLKDAPPEDMLAAIRTVHRGDAVIAPSSTRRLLAHLAHTLPSDERRSSDILDQLTTREREVLTHMARGLSNAEIAAELFVAEATVKTHVGRVLQKLSARDRVQAVVVAYETGLAVPGA